MTERQSVAHELFDLAMPGTRVCGRPKLGTGLPCRSRMKTYYVACYGHMTAEEREEAARDDVDREYRIRRLGGIFDRKDVITYLRWRVQLPDLSSLEDMDQWEAFVDAHDDRCALCRGGAGRLVIDHDHTTGLIRGLLCRPCNSGAISGIAHANHTRMLGMKPADALYCQYPPTSAMGMRRKYADPFGRPAASRVRDVLWHAGPDGIEHERDAWLRRSMER